MTLCHISFVVCLDEYIVLVNWITMTRKSGKHLVALVKQLVLGKENSVFNPVKLRLKSDFVLYPALVEELVNT